MYEVKDLLLLLNLQYSGCCERLKKSPCWTDAPQPNICCLYLYVPVCSSLCSLACPAGYELEAERCYKHVATPTETGDGAQAACVADGANLVSINDATENAYVKGKFGQVSDKKKMTLFLLVCQTVIVVALSFRAPWGWIGLHETDVEGTFVWLDGSPCKCVVESFVKHGKFLKCLQNLKSKTRNVFFSLLLKLAS